MQQLDIEGFEILNEFYSDQEIGQLKQLVDGSNTDKPTFRRANGLFAVRQFFREFPNAFKIVFSAKFIKFLLARFGPEYFVVKSIYFDKPVESNWFVSYHQDLTISVDKRMEISGFGPWTVKQNQFAVQPPLEILKDNFTVRIHLDNTNVENGALRVIPKSHLFGIRRIEGGELESSTEVTCSVERGGIMLMKPLLLHSSSRTLNNARRRVVHIEFSRSELPSGLNWSEKESYLACP
jgi:ectoine hydroxylase-related dioxygenase (phytanoyl-CoA dioxygenase family)